MSEILSLVRIPASTSNNIQKANALLMDTQPYLFYINLLKQIHNVQIVGLAQTNQKIHTPPGGGSFKNSLLSGDEADGPLSSSYVQTGGEIISSAS